jgi:IPT/TIG domain
MTVTGTGFAPYSKIVFNGGDEVTTFVSETELSTIIKPSLAGAAIAVPVTVRNGTKVSNMVQFTFTDVLARGARKR